MIVHFDNFDFLNANKEKVIAYICKKWKVQSFQIIFADGSIMLTDKLGDIFGYIATYK